MTFKKKSQNNFAEFLKLIPFFKPYKKDIFLALIALFITALMILFFGHAIKYIIDFGFSQKNIWFFNISLSVFVLLVLIMSVAGFYRSSLINSVCEKVINDIRKKIYNHVIKISPEFFENNKVADVISRLTSDTAVLYDVFSNNFSFLLRNLLLFFGGLFLLFFTSIKLSLISISLIFLAILPIFVIGKNIKNLSKKVQENSSELMSFLNETLSAISTIQAYCCEEKEAGNFSKKTDNFLNNSLTKIKTKSLLVAIVIFLSFLAIAVVFWIGGRDVLQGKLSSGELSAFIFYAIISAFSLVGLSQVMSHIQSASAAIERIFYLLKIESNVKEIANPIEKIITDKIEISFKNVDFSYSKNNENLILKNFNLEIKQGQKILICGESGIGKSTIFKLLLRFYDVNSGEILINNLNIKNFSFANLRNNFSYISQDPFIFSGTIFENISYADKNITRKEVENLINNNSAFYFIKKLPNGIDSLVGEVGHQLSGGQRQRIAFARAILKDSQILLFDEITSALDLQNEKEIFSMINDLAFDKTIIMIAHKIPDDVKFDRVIRM